MEDHVDLPSADPVVVPPEVSAPKANGADAPNPDISLAAEAVAAATVSEAISLQEQVKDLQERLRLSEINRCLERRNSLMAMGLANQLQMNETMQELFKLGWKPPQQ